MTELISPDEYESHSFLVVFAVDQYKSPRLDNLNCAVADGKLVVKTFTQFGFQVFAELYNEQVTSASIEKTLYDLMNKFPIRKSGRFTNRVGRLYIMFAGHGVPDTTKGDDTSVSRWSDAPSLLTVAAVQRRADAILVQLTQRCVVTRTAVRCGCRSRHFALATRALALSGAARAGLA